MHATVVSENPRGKTALAASGSCRWATVPRWPASGLHRGPNGQRASLHNSFLNFHPFSGPAAAAAHLVVASAVAAGPGRCQLFRIYTFAHFGLIAPVGRLDHASMSTLETAPLETDSGCAFLHSPIVSAMLQWLLRISRPSRLTPAPHHNLRGFASRRQSEGRDLSELNRRHPAERCDKESPFQPTSAGARQGRTRALLLPRASNGRLCDVCSDCRSALFYSSSPGRTSSNERRGGGLWLFFMKTTLFQKIGSPGCRVGSWSLSSASWTAAPGRLWTAPREEVVPTAERRSVPTVDGYFSAVVHRRGV
jgi:hypothetical protein